MSPDPELERLLREASKTLPEPDADATLRAHNWALAAVRLHRPRRYRVAALVGVMVVGALAIGVGLGALVASGTASSGPVGLGFLPEPGWYALQAAAPMAPDQPLVAMAANVPFADEDVVRGLAEPSGLPYSTLLTLPPRGAVIVATFLDAEPQPGSGLRLGTSSRYPARKLPFRIQDATPYIEYGTQLRPDEPLAQYQLRAAINGHLADVHIYFGMPTPSDALRAEVQRQLARLVVAETSPAPAAKTGTSRPTAVAAPSAPAILDRTSACAPALLGGVRQIDTRAHRGSGRHGAAWNQPAFAGVETSISGSAATAIEDELAWVSAGRPSPGATVVSTLVGYTFPFRSWGTVAVNAKRCRASSARVPLGRAGLRGGAAGPIDDRWDCATGRRVLVRVRAVLGSQTALRSFRGFLRTTVPVREASLAVRTQSGKPLVYAQVFQSGKSLLFTSPTCFPD
jgi:hypothetical protein